MDKEPADVFAAGGDVEEKATPVSVFRGVGKPSTRARGRWGSGGAVGHPSNEPRGGVSMLNGHGARCEIGSRAQLLLRERQQRGVLMVDSTTIPRRRSTRA